jgi:four helix bundle protein
MRLKHRDLRVWQESMKLVKLICITADSLPEKECFGLSAQMRRAAVSIPCNIAEGSARNTKAQFLQFLFIARGSLSELETQILITQELGYLSETKALEEAVERVFAMFSALIRLLKRKDS